MHRYDCTLQFTPDNWFIANKIILYKTLIRPVVSYGAEAWTLTRKEEQAVLIFERKIFRRIYGPKCETGNGKVGRIEN